MDCVCTCVHHNKPFSVFQHSLSLTTFQSLFCLILIALTVRSFPLSEGTNNTLLLLYYPPRFSTVTMQNTVWSSRHPLSRGNTFSYHHWPQLSRKQKPFPVDFPSSSWSLPRPSSRNTLISNRALCLRIHQRRKATLHTGESEQAQP